MSESVIERIVREETEALAQRRAEHHEKEQQQ